MALWTAARGMKFVYVVLTILSNTAAQIFLKEGTTQMRESFFSILTVPSFYYYVLLQGAGTIAWVLALREIELGVAFAFLAVLYITIPVGSYLFHDEKFTLTQIIGFGVIMLRVTLVGKR